jgi:hypothetical protein
MDAVTALLACEPMQEVASMGLPVCLIFWICPKLQWLFSFAEILFDYGF